MKEIPRVVTNKEVFEEHFVKRWKECLKIAHKELSKIPLEIPLTWEALCATTATLFICRNQNEGRIANLCVKKQKMVDSQTEFNKKEEV